MDHLDQETSVDLHDMMFSLFSSDLDDHIKPVTPPSESPLKVGAVGFFWSLETSSPGMSEEEPWNSMNMSMPDVPDVQFGNDHGVYERQELKVMVMNYCILGSTWGASPEMSKTRVPCITWKMGHRPLARIASENVWFDSLDLWNDTVKIHKTYSIRIIAGWWFGTSFIFPLLFGMKLYQPENFGRSDML